MDFSYKKNNNLILFESLEKSDLLNISDPQNYIPIYKRFFNLSKSNNDLINLNNKFNLKQIINKETENKFQGILVDGSGNEFNKMIFFKLIPLLDPIKYMMNKYDTSNNNLFNLPIFDETNCHEKINNINNSAYVDSFFSYLSSQLFHKHDFIHGIDYYGSFLAKKNDLMIDICEDLEYLYETSAFQKNKDKLFFLDNTFHSEILNYNTRNYKKKIQLEDISVNNIELSDINDITQLDNLFINDINNSNNSNKINLLYEDNNKRNSKNSSNTSSSSCSSRSSNTDKISNQDEDSISSGEYSTASEDEVYVKFPQFPIQLTALECCDKTLDTLIINGVVSNQDWDSIVLQILMILITYQKSV